MKKLGILTIFSLTLIFLTTVSFSMIPIYMLPNSTYVSFNVTYRGQKIDGEIKAVMLRRIGEITYETSDGKVYYTSGTYYEFKKILPKELDIVIPYSYYNKRHELIKGYWIPDGIFGYEVSNNSYINFTYPKFKTIPPGYKLRLLVHTEKGNFISQSFNLNVTEAEEYNADLKPNGSIVLTKIYGHYRNTLIYPPSSSSFYPYYPLTFDDIFGIFILIIIEILIGLFTGYFYIRKNNNFKRILFTLFISMLIIPTVIFIIPSILLYNLFNFLDISLLFSGILSIPIEAYFIYRLNKKYIDFNKALKLSAIANIFVFIFLTTIFILNQL